MVSPSDEARASDTPLSRRLDEQIRDFVSQPGHERVLRATGSYSTPFRGTLFGTDDSTEVERRRSARPVRAVWLGSNPNCPQSLHALLNDDAPSEFPYFVRQMESGRFSEQQWEPEGAPRPGWNPIVNPSTSGWTVVRDVFALAGDVDDVAMANIVPWGSADLPALVTQVSAASPSLAREMLAFSFELAKQMIVALQPNAIIVPLSIARLPLPDATLCNPFSMSAKVDLNQVVLSSGRSSVGYWWREGDAELPCPRIVYFRHPSSLRLSAPLRTQLIESLGALVA